MNEDVPQEPNESPSPTNGQRGGSAPQDTGMQNLQFENFNGYAFEDIPIEITVILGTADIDISNLLKIGRGAVIELNRMLQEPVELRCQGQRIGEGKVVIGENSRLSVKIDKMFNQKSSPED